MRKHLQAFMMQDRQTTMSSDWPAIPLPKDGVDRFIYDAGSIRQMEPEPGPGKEYHIMQSFPELLDDMCPIHQMGVEDARKKVLIRLKFTLEQARKYATVARDLREDAFMRFQPFNTARRTGEEQFSLIDRAIECLEEETLYQRAVSAARVGVYNDRAVAAAQTPGLRRPLLSDTETTMDSRNEHKNSAMDGFARLWTGAEKDQEGQPRRPFHVHDQRYSGWMSVNDRDAATCEEYFALVDCTPDGTEQGQNYKAYLRDRDGIQPDPDEPAGSVVA
jgi:hypothetical protein